MTTGSPEYVLIGQLNREYILPASNKPYLDQPGGSVLYAAGGVKVWVEPGSKVGLVARVGEEFPRQWLDSWVKMGLDIRGIKVLSEPADLRWFIAYEENGKSFRSDPVAQFLKRKLPVPKELAGFHGGYSTAYSANSSLQLKGSDLPREFQNAVAAHLCPMDYLAHSLLPAVLRGAGVSMVTLDPDMDYMHPDHWHDFPALLPGLTAFIPSLQSIQSLFRGRTEDLWEMMEALAGYGCDTIVVKAGSRGQYLYDRASNKRYEIPAYPSRVVDQTGCGNVFCGGFLAGFKRFENPLDAVLCGSVAASFAVEGFGPFFAAEMLPGLRDARLQTLREMSYEA